ncbi:probable aspartic protease At2g35615 [Phoenix dactylifera]|uniref:Probable aspartic protease At2g35615 n=1 Tax=Phoenix dactylifera TaxID=42345 RepID=A0A8B8ZM16_PHODC|nr:probable aspartic protease At2g35615 [Phoenix dactylifera]
MASPLTNLYFICLIAFVFRYAHGNAVGLHEFDVLGSWSNYSCSSGGNITRGLPIIHRLSPCAPQKLRLNFTSELDRHYLDDKLTLGTDSRLSRERNYLVVIGLGTPKKDFHVMFDTGSSLTWVQCEPCRKCYDQAGPPRTVRYLSPPNLAATFRTVAAGPDK